MKGVRLPAACVCLLDFLVGNPNAPFLSGYTSARDVSLSARSPWWGTGRFCFGSILSILQMQNGCNSLTSPVLK
jgi:hypothetical protein